MKNSQGKANATIKRRKKKVLWLLLGGIGGAFCLVLLLAVGLYFGSQFGIGLGIFGYRQNPVYVGTPVADDPLKFLVTGIHTTALTENGTSYALDAYRVLVNGTITCSLPPGQSCQLDEIDAELVTSSSQRDIELHWTDFYKNKIIPGGESIRFEYTSFFIQNEKDLILPGERVHFKIKLDGILKVRTFWIENFVTE
ncbi:hypothetical protein KQH62_04975 [bacterium]|nr:hypothetical protein [bacterium]